MFDLFLYPLHYQASREQPDLPGLLACAPPRRVERHRAGEMLVTLLSAPGGSPPAPLLAEMFELLSTRYYNTSGTVTAALRAAAAAVNETLLERNLQARAGESQCLNASVIALRGSRVVVAQAGSMHTYLSSKNGFEVFHDPALGPGLGTAPDLNLRFFQAEVDAGDLLLVCPNPPESWAAFSPNVGLGTGPEAARRRLLSQLPVELSAGLVQLKTGSGGIHFMRRSGESAEKPAAAADEQPAAPEPLPREAPPSPVSPAHLAASEPHPHETPIRPPLIPQPAAREFAPEAQPWEQPLNPPAAAYEHPIFPPGEDLPSAAEPAALTARRRQRPEPAWRGVISRLFHRTSQDDPVSQPALEPEAHLPAAAPGQPAGPDAQPARRAWWKGLARLVRGTRTAQSETARTLGKVIPRVLPSRPEKPASISPATLFFIAVAVPVIVVAVSTTVYMRTGASQERVAFMQQARVYAGQAAKQDDTTLKRGAWEQTIYWVKKAEEYGQDEESSALHRRAQSALDSIDGIVRLSLAPAFSGTLGSQVQITRLVATAGDLYMLDSLAGRVLHMKLVGGSYEYDPNFSCGPGPSGGRIVGPLIGMAPLPLNNEEKASILAVDAAGNLLYCINGESPLSTNLTPPENNWGKVTAMTLSEGNLYLLDVPQNAVYRLDGDNYKYPGLPRLFFGHEVPNLSDVIDLTVYQDELYLLHSTGMMTVCTWSDFNFSPTRCSDPSPYGDSRSAGPVDSIPDTRFLQLLTTQPPDPSLFMLDSAGNSIYHFSLRLNLQRQLRQDPASDFPLPAKPVTAFTINSTRMIFLAFGNQVFYGILP